MPAESFTLSAGINYIYNYIKTRIFLTTNGLSDLRDVRKVA